MTEIITSCKTSAFQATLAFCRIIAVLQAAIFLSLISPVPSSASSPEAELPETITIDGHKYVVPPPWSGNRLEAPALDFSSFLKIPEKYTKDNSKIYILARAQPALVEMLSKAEEDGVFFQVESGYRSKSYQRKIFKRMFEEGRTFEDVVRYVAPPGYSNHMFGTAVDFYPSNWRFADTPQYKWLQDNAAKFNFDETYSEFNKMQMPWEAWHWNYIEGDLAQAPDPNTIRPSDMEGP